MSLALRKATNDDATAIATILSDWIDQTPWMPRIHTREQDRGFGAFLIEKTEVWVAGDDQIVGFLATRDSSIEALYVNKDDRGAGVGSQLIRQAKGDNDQLELWCFQSNLDAQRFYTRHGFQEIQRTDGAGNDEKLPDIRFRWQAEAVT